MTGVKRHSVERGAGLDAGARVPLERTGETFGNLQALPATHAALHNTSEVTGGNVPMSGPGPADEAPMTAALNSGTGGGRLKGKKAHSIAQGASPKKRGLARFSQPENDMPSSLQLKMAGGAAQGLQDQHFAEKNRELLGGLDLSSTKQGSKTLSMFSAITKAGLPKKFNLPVLLNEGSVVEQFYAARPDQIRLTLEQQKQIQQTFYDVRSQQDIVSDPLLLSLANIRNSVVKTKKNKSNDEAENL